jgi:hypothetical protein
LAKNCKGVIAGFGLNSYKLAVDSLVKLWIFSVLFNEGLPDDAFRVNTSIVYG